MQHVAIFFFLVLSTFVCWCWFYFLASFALLHPSALGFSFNMTKRDSCLAGINSPRAPTSMQRRHLQFEGQSSSGATSSGQRPQPSSAMDNLAPQSHPGIDHSDSSSYYGYASTAPSVPLPDAHAHHIPMQPLREEAYPLQAEIEQQHRILHTPYSHLHRGHVSSPDRSQSPHGDRSGSFRCETKPSTGVLLQWDCWSHSCRPSRVDKLLGTIYPTCQLLASSLQYSRSAP